MTAEAQTDEQTAETPVAAWESAAYCQIPVPDVPYSAIRFPLVGDPVQAAAWADRALKMAAYLQRKYRETFPGAQPEASQRPQERAQRPQQGGAVSHTPVVTGGRPGIGYFCPDHRVPVLKTTARYDKDGDRYYHRLAESEWYQLEDGRTARNHNLYLRQLVNADGEPVEEPF